MSSYYNETSEFGNNWNWYVEPTFVNQTTGNYEELCQREVG